MWLSAAARYIFLDIVRFGGEKIVDALNGFDVLRNLWLEGFFIFIKSILRVEHPWPQIVMYCLGVHLYITFYTCSR